MFQLCPQFYSEPEGIEAAVKNNEDRVNYKNTQRTFGA